MGSSESMDTQVQLYTTVSKSVYYAGEVVEGVAHVNCLTNRPYEFLQLRLRGL